jgi:hypothetical protein
MGTDWEQEVERGIERNRLEAKLQNQQLERRTSVEA